MEDTFDIFFKAFVRGVFNSGGDGCGTLAVKHTGFNHEYNYRAIADKFGEYEIEYTDGSKHKIKDIYKRHDEKECILFTDESNENFIIRQHEKHLGMGPYEDIFMVI